MKNISEKIRFVASKSSGEVSGLVIVPQDMNFFLVFAHGAGAGMEHSFMEEMSYTLSEAGIGTLRYNFPYSEKKKKSPDPAPLLIETVHSAIKKAKDFAKGVPLLAGGKSMGGRMTSMAASMDLVEDIKGIIFFGFPLHSPGKPSDERALHLFNVKIPMLFLQGSRDNLADLQLLTPVITKLGDKATIHIVDGGDHSFHLPKTNKKTDDNVFKEVAVKVTDWSGVI